MSHFDRRCVLTLLAAGAAIASVRGGVTWALMRPAERWRHGRLPILSAEEWKLEEALLRGDYIVVQ